MEKPKIKVLVIPANSANPCFTAMVEPTFEAYRKVVPGWDEGTTLEVCPSIVRGGDQFSVYIDEEGLMNEPDPADLDKWVNERVSLLIGHNNSGYGHWGGALVAGAPDDEGNETAVPELLLSTLRYNRWKIEEK